MNVKPINIIVCLLLWCNSPSFGQQKSIMPLADSVQAMAEELIKKGFNAGDGYGEVWIRDFNTFMDVACKVHDRASIRKSLTTFFLFQQKDGAILDGYVPKAKTAGAGYNYYYTNLAPDYAGHKNTVETDQETSLVQAVAKYIRSTGDKAFLKDVVADTTVQDRLAAALQFLLNKRYDKKYGLLWGATTADWGDVQPEHDWGVELNANSHRAIDIYDNAMFVIAIDDFLSLAQLTPSEWRYWKNTRDNIKKNIRKHLWDARKEKYRPHIYLS